MVFKCSNCGFICRKQSEIMRHMRTYHLTVMISVPRSTNELEKALKNPQFQGPESKKPTECEL